MKKLDRIIYSRNIENGDVTETLNPNLIYFDTSALIDIFNAHVIHQEKIFQEIADAINDSKFRILLSIVNFLELIGKGEKISINFSKDYISAINYVPIISANQPTIITDQEVQRFMERANNGVYIFDNDQLALKELTEGAKQYELGNSKWFSDKRQWWDEMQERDRTLDLEADIWELSGIKPESSYGIKQIKNILTSPIQDVRNKRAELIKKKHRFKGKKQHSTEEQEILKYVENRITFNIGRKYGEEKVCMLITNPHFIFPKEKNILADIINDLKRGMELTYTIVKDQLPGLYWQAKVTYYNYFYGHQSAGGQSGDRNHAIYIPYSNYFATCDRLLVRALESEYKIIYCKDNIRLFKIN